MRKLAAIMFTDIVGYTARMARNEGDALELLQQARQIIRPLITKYNGQWLKEIGDGTLSSFDSATEAVTCAVAIQRSLAQSGGFQLRIGIHLGDVVFEEGDVFGDGVNVASRIESQASPGGICVTEQVYDSIRNKPGIEAVFLGKRQLKNVTRPIKVFALTCEGLPAPVTKGKAVRETMPSPWAGISWKSFTAAAVVVILAGAGFVLSRRFTPSDAITSIAVLPLDNYTGDPAQDYFVNGIHEALIARLAQIKALKVISRTSVMPYRGLDKPIPRIARELGVDAIVEGSVTKAADSVRITAQLIHGRSDEHLWANQFDRHLRNILTLQNEVALAIAGQIHIALTPAEESRFITAAIVNPQAYDAYLKGRDHWDKRTGDDLALAVQYFNEAVKIDPSSPLGYCGLADAFNMIGSYSYYPPRDVLPKAKAMAMKALSIDSTRAEAYTSLAAVLMNYDWDWVAAERNFKKALDLNPGYALAHHWYAQYLMAVGKTEQSLQSMKFARGIDPLSIWMTSGLGRKFYFAHQFDEAIFMCRKALEIDSSAFLAATYLGLSYLHEGLYAQAVSSLEMAVRYSGQSPLIKGVLGFVYARVSREADARRILDELLVLSSTGYVPAISLVALYTGLGNHDEAFAWMERAYKDRHHYLIFINAEPMIDPLRSDPRFAEYVAKVGLD